MGFWIFMLVMDLLVPFTMIGFGWYFLRKAPRSINSAFGYRTNMSMKNKDTWEFAHKFCGKLWFICGLILLPLSIVPMLFMLGKTIGSIGAVGGIVCMAQLIPLVGTIIPTEIALKRNFDKNGNRKNIETHD